ncbi:S-layer homology domain-containing protein, partial [Patescibacteria group bacterium]|nr:S-layer homology domain-containing protein [Patescibacteria group bacterium]
MIMYQKIRRPVSVFMMSVLTLSLFAFAPVASAANPLIQNVNIGLDPFHIKVPNQSAVVHIVYDYNTGGYVTGPVLEQIRDVNDGVIYEFGNTGNDDKASGQYQLVWDGTYKNGTSKDGEYVSDGTYKIYIYSETASLPAAEYESSFAVENTVIPKLTLLSEPPNAYYTPSGSYDINYSLALNSASTSIARLTVDGPLNNNPQQEVISEVKGADGNYIVSWDGKINGNTVLPGQYSYKLYADGSVDGFTVPSNELTGEITVSNEQNPQPTVSGLSASPDPYDPSGGSVTLGYSLAGSLGSTTINAQVYNSADPNKSLESWSFNGQGNGSNSVSWDGKDSNQALVADGSYVFKVWGEDGSFDIVSQQVSFVVTASETPVQERCADFTDVSINSPSCPAITYVKSIGAMTGNPDGTFAPSASLQRDQIAKISLETFGL